MNTQTLLEYQWPYLLSFFPRGVDLDASAREAGALVRRRRVDSASALLRLALAYGFCGLSLRQAAAWAEAAEVASLSDVALLKRLRRASEWLGQLLGLKLAERASPLPSTDTEGLHLRLVDATTVSRPGSTGTDWRVHLGFQLASLAIDHIELTDVRGGETLARFRFAPGELVIGDRGYAHRRGLHSVVEAGGDFIVRLNWQNVPLQHPEGTPFDILAALRTLPEATEGEFPVTIASKRRDGIPPIPARLVALRKTEAAAQEARKKVMRERARKGQAVDPRTLEAAGYVFVVTSADCDTLPARQVLELYRFRWQIEIYFKRLKGLLHLGELPAKDPQLARTFLYSKLLAALLLDDFTECFLAFSPWGYRLG